MFVFLFFCLQSNLPDLLLLLDVLCADMVQSMTFYFTFYRISHSL